MKTSRASQPSDGVERQDLRDHAGDGSRHTPGPWSTSYREGRDGGMWRQDIYDVHGETIATCAWYRVPTADGYTTNREANAEFIVRACNSHAELLAALKELRDACAAAMRVIAQADLADAFVAEATAAGVTNGFGIRADRVIAKAEGRPAPAKDRP
jgi:hypothetical protein